MCSCLGLVLGDFCTVSMRNPDTPSSSCDHDRYTTCERLGQSMRVCVCPCPQHVCLFKRLLKLFFSSFHLATSPYHLWNNKGVLKQSSVSCACAEVRRGVDGVHQEKFVCQLLFLLHAQGWSWKWILSCKANLSYTYLPDKIYTK